MIFTLILGLLIALVAVIFATQNTEVVTVSFFTLEIDQPLAIIIMVAFGLGILMVALVSLPGFFKRRRTISSQKKELGLHEKKIQALSLELTEAKVATEKTQAAIFAVKEELKEAQTEVEKAKEEAAEARLAVSAAPPAAGTPPSEEAAPVVEGEEETPSIEEDLKPEDKKDKKTGNPGSSIYKV